MKPLRGFANPLKAEYCRLGIDAIIFAFFVVFAFFRNTLKAEYCRLGIDTVIFAFFVVFAFFAISKVKKAIIISAISAGQNNCTKIRDNLCNSCSKETGLQIPIINCVGLQIRRYGSRTRPFGAQTPLLFNALATPIF